MLELLLELLLVLGAAAGAIEAVASVIGTTTGVIGATTSTIAIEGISSLLFSLISFSALSRSI